mgnify:CR=1 FL=1
MNRNKKKYEFVEAKDAFGKRVRHKKNATNDKNDIKLITIGDNQYEMDNFLKSLQQVCITTSNICQTRQIKDFIKHFTCKDVI